MKNPMTALKMMLAILVIAGSFGCSKGNNNAGGSPGFNAYPGGGYPGGVVAPGGLLFAATAHSQMTNPSLIVDFELNFLAGPAGGASGATVAGLIRMSASDAACQVQANPGQVLQIIPQQSQVTITTSGNVTTVQGTLAVQLPTGLILQISLYNDLVDSHVQAPAVGQITGQAFPYSLEGMTVVQSGQCAQTPNWGWPLLAM